MVEDEVGSENMGMVRSMMDKEVVSMNGDEYGGHKKW